jgi:hypothetical protein
MENKLTHDELIAIGKKWLSVQHGGKDIGYHQSGMGVILTEFVCYADNIPDVIGFNSDISVQIECKVSHSDFLADLKKPHRHDSNRTQLGNYRYYLAPPEVIKTEEVPDTWGLLVWTGKQVEIIKQAEFHNSFDVRNAEFPILYSIARRAEVKGFLPEIVKPLPPPVIPEWYKEYLKSVKK